MRQMMGRGLAALFAYLCLAVPAQAAWNKNILPETARMAPAGRGVQVIVPQAEIGVNINPSMMTQATGGGLLGAAIDAKIDTDHAHTAQSGINPIRRALSDFDTDALAIATTRSLVASIPWFQATSSGFGRDDSPMGKSRVLASGTEGEVVFFDYTYDFSQDFSSMRVAVNVVVAVKAGADGSAQSQLSAPNLIYSQNVTSIVQLQPQVGGGADDNSRRWAANEGALSRRALTAAFNEVGVLIPRALVLTNDDLTKMHAADRRSLAHVSGNVVEDGPGGVLLFNSGLIHVQTIRE